MNLRSVYDLIGEDGFSDLVAAFYRRVKTDDLIGPMYPPNDWEGSEQRLRDFLVYRFGGPSRYVEQRGNPRLRARHLPFTIGETERDRWIELMTGALVEVALPEEANMELKQFFASAADFMRNQ